MKCQLGVMEEPKENADKVSWTAYGAPHRPLRWEKSTLCTSGSIGRAADL